MKKLYLLRVLKTWAWVLTWVWVIAVPVIVYLLNRAWLAELIECVSRGLEC